jgi:hypothetical protein
MGGSGQRKAQARNDEKSCIFRRSTSRAGKTFSDSKIYQ